jgi:hypothetical protein
MYALLSFCGAKLIDLNKHKICTLWGKSNNELLFERNEMHIKCAIKKYRVIKKKKPMDNNANKSTNG